MSILFTSKNFTEVLKELTYLEEQHCLTLCNLLFIIILLSDKFNRMSDELILSVFRWLPKFMLARSAQVCRRFKRLAFDETLWRRLDLGGKTLKPGVVGRVILRGSTILRLAKAEVSAGYRILIYALKYVLACP